jgi:uncharacterized protein (TIGR00369 family)
MLDPEIIRFYEQGVAFNRWLGMRVESVDDGRCVMRVPFRPELVGDPFRPALHGGVTATLADAAGGLAVFAAVGTLNARVSTIDLRVDYYLPAELKDLVAEATLANIGNRVGVARILLHHDDPTRIVAEGRGVYNIARRLPNEGPAGV